MRPRRSSVLLLTAAGLALLAAACSDPIGSPSLRAPTGSPAFTIGPTPNVGAVLATLASSGTTQFCSAATALRTYTIPASFPPAAGCGTAVDVQNNAVSGLAVYNPGWTNNLTGSVWIGPTVAGGTSNEYRPVPGTYVFQSTFTLPAGATSIVLNDTLLSDNAVAVYLNGFKLEQQVIADCTDPTGVSCNWTGAKFVISDASATNPTHFVTGTNTVTVLLVDTPIGGNAGNNFACTKPFQPFGALGFSGVNNVPTSPLHIVANWQQNAATGCENPAGLDFHGGVSWVPFHPIALFVIGDVEPHGVGANVNFWGAQWWKNNQMSGVTDNGYESFKGYAVTSDNVCGGKWTSLPGNSSNPPDAIGADIAIIVTTKVLKSGNDISGDIKQIVIVHQDGGYGPNPGHDGNGPVTSIFCTAP